VAADGPSPGRPWRSGGGKFANPPSAPVLHFPGPAHEFFPASALHDCRAALAEDPEPGNAAFALPGSTQPLAARLTRNGGRPRPRGLGWPLGSSTNGTLDPDNFTPENQRGSWSAHRFRARFCAHGWRSDTLDPELGREKCAQQAACLHAPVRCSLAQQAVRRAVPGDPAWLRQWDSDLTFGSSANCRGDLQKRRHHELGPIFNPASMIIPDGTCPSGTPGRTGRVSLVQ